MRTILRVTLFSLVILGLCLPVSAIVVADYSVATNPPTGDWDLNWDYVYNYKKSSSVAVGAYWILTAAHVADDVSSSVPTFSNIVVNGTTYYPQEIIPHAAADDPEHSNQADLALVRFDKPFPGWYPLYTGDFPTSFSKKLDAVMVGYGVTGTVSSTYYNPAAWNDPSSGIKRWGSQKIDGTDTANYDVSGTTGVTYNDGIEMQFNTLLSGTLYEAGVGTYDSGGGTFIKESEMWKLAGINTIQYSGSLGYTGTFAVSVPAYATWITQTMDSITGDDDSDGIPNWWEEQFGTNIVAASDQDGDGFTGEEEYTADTDPTDSNSFWQMEGKITSANQTFTFEGSAARQYQLLYTTNGLAAPGLTWITNGVPIWGEGSGTEIVITNTENMVFYRMQAILP